MRDRCSKIGHGFAMEADIMNPDLPPLRAAHEAWQSVLGQLQMEMPRASFDTWVRDTQVSSFDPSTGSGQAAILTISVRNNYARDWLESRLTSTVARLLIGIMNQSVQVRFVVGEDEPEEEPEDGEEESEPDEDLMHRAGPVAGLRPHRAAAQTGGGQGVSAASGDGDRAEGGLAVHRLPPGSLDVQIHGKRRGLAQPAGDALFRPELRGFLAPDETS